MYKLLLATRYLRTRFIALASIISVMLGVATMIVVNSVMSGFSTQMKDRIHGILADMIVETTSTDGTDNPVALMREIERVAGKYIDAMTPTVEIYGMMSFDWMGETVYRPVTLIGIIPAGKDAVSPLAQYLQSRQEIVNGDVVWPALRDSGDPLDWELLDEYIKVRTKWIEAQRISDFRDEYEQARTSTPGPYTDSVYHISPQSPDVPPNTPVPGSVELTAGTTPLTTDPTTVPTTAASDPFADPFQDPFGGAPAEPIDPLLPEPARVYIGSGLVSFPYKDKESGQTLVQYMVQPGQDINLTTIKTGKPEPATFKATIVDIFKSGMSEYDSNLVFCNLEELQFARGMLTGPDPRHPHKDLDWRQGGVTTIQIKLKDYRDAPEVQRRLRAELPTGWFQVRTWEQKQGPLLEAVAVESAILNVLLFLIIAVAGFGILAIFYMIVVEKTRDIGIMKALGAGSRGINTIFLSYGLSLGLVGSGGGVVLGLLFVHYINQIEDLLSWLTGHKVFDETIYYFNKIPVTVQPMMVCWVALGAVSIAVLASVLPARRAARLHPVQALRYE